jgi:DNA modification methylase
MITTSLVNANANMIPLADKSVHCIVTSPPYWDLRDYGVAGQLGAEDTPDQYVDAMLAVGAELWRVLRDDGTLWLNLGDSYAGSWGGYGQTGPGSQRPRNSEFYDRPGYDGRSKQRPAASRRHDGIKNKDLVGIPWLVAFAFRAAGWWLRRDIVWSKTNPMPESVRDRPVGSHEYVFLLSKSRFYYYDRESVQVPASASSLAHLDPVRNLRSVWTIATSPYTGAHFATFPPTLAQTCILAGTSAAGVCPTCGAPFERITEKSDQVDPSSKGSYYDRGKTNVNSAGRAQPGERYLNKTAGWAPSCGGHGHDLDPVPAMVFDPFAGSGTTLQGARQLGRSSIGCDLKLSYLRENARPRLQLDKLAAWHGQPNPQADDLDGLPLLETFSHDL